MALQGREFASPLCAIQNVQYGLLPSRPLTCVLESSLARIDGPSAGNGLVEDDFSGGTTDSTMFKPRNHTAALAATTLLVTLRPEQLVLSAIKQAERESGFVVRLYNPFNRTIVGELQFVVPVQVSAVNLNENRVAQPIVEARSALSVRVSVLPFKIVSLLCKP